MKIAIAGATGSIGAPVAAELIKRGHGVRALSRRSEQHPVDLETGAGLAGALEGCDALVDASNGGPAEKAARAVLIEGGRRLLDAAAEAGIRHHVCISIVGIEAVPLPYYRVKVEQEGQVEASGVPYSIVRATQFHTLLDGLFTAASRYRLLPGGAARIQPVDPIQVAEVIAAWPRASRRAGARRSPAPRCWSSGRWRAAGARSGVCGRPSCAPPCRRSSVAPSAAGP